MVHLVGIGGREFSVSRLAGCHGVLYETIVRRHIDLDLPPKHARRNPECQEHEPDCISREKR